MKKKQIAKEKIYNNIKTDVYFWKKDRLKKVTFANVLYNIAKNVKEGVLFKNYKERFERSLHLCH